MTTRVLAIVAGLALLMGTGALPAHAQDILGLSLRPTDAMDGSPGNGTLDITTTNGAGKYTIKVDMSAAGEGLDLSAHEGATQWVAWAVDMDGMRHNLGALDGELMLESVPVDYMVARVYVTAEASAEVKSPSAPLFVVTLRQVEEVETATDSAADDDGAADDESAEKETKEEQPKELPTTGGPLQDMMLLLLVAAALVFGGMRLRTGVRA